MVACFVLGQIGIACERARLPHLCGQPLALADAGQTLQVVSPEAAACGLRPRQSVSSARSLCEPLVILPYDREAYESGLHCVWDLFAIESSAVEPVSPELCFAELRGPDIEARTRWLAERLAKAVRIPIRVGLARTKLVAHQAARQAGADGVLTVEVGTEAGLLAAVPISRLPRLEPELRRRLQRLGVRTLGDVMRLPPRELDHQFRQMSLLLRRLALGQDGDRVRALWPPCRIEVAHTFEDEVVDMLPVEQGLKRLADRIAAGLVHRNEHCRTLLLRVGLADGSQVADQEQLSSPANDGDRLHRAALRLLKRLKIDRPILSLHLQASELGATVGVQLALLDERNQAFPHERRQRLEAALAYLRRRYGIGAVITCALLRQARRINLWTHALARLSQEPVQVATDARGQPVRCHRRSRTLAVRHVCDRWKETAWAWNRVMETTAYRIETDPSGLYELHRIGVEWRLTGTAD